MKECAPMFSFSVQCLSHRSLQFSLSVLLFFSLSLSAWASGSMIWGERWLMIIPSDGDMMRFKWTLSQVFRVISRNGAWGEGCHCLFEKSGHQGPLVNMVNDPKLIHFQKGSLWIMISSQPTDRFIKTFPLHHRTVSPLMSILTYLISVSA